MKKFLCVFVALLLVVLALPMTSSAMMAATTTTGKDPVHDAVDNMVTAMKLAGIAACNGGAKSRDKEFGFTAAGITDTLPSGTKVVFEKTPDAFLLQAYPFAAAVATAWGATGFMFYACPAESAVNIHYQNQKMEGKENLADGKYDSFVIAEILGGSETKISSFVITMPSDNSFMKGQLNAFDLYVGSDAFDTTSKADDSNSSYKLAWSGENLVDTMMWKTSADGTYSYIEANLTTPMVGSYVAVAFTANGYTTCPHGSFKTVEGGTTLEAEGTECWFVNIGEFAFFDTTIEEASAPATTEEITTAAPVVTTAAPAVTTAAPVVTTEAPKTTTEAPKTEAPVITAAPTTEPVADKKGCGASVVILPVVAVIAAAVVVRRKKED